MQVHARVVPLEHEVVGADDEPADHQRQRDEGGATQRAPHPPREGDTAAIASMPTSQGVTWAPPDMRSARGTKSSVRKATSKTNPTAASDPAAALAFIWLAHIGADRALGYGLRYPASFDETHLGRVGRSRHRATGP